MLSAAGRHERRVQQIYPRITRIAANHPENFRARRFHFPKIRVHSRDSRANPWFRLV